MRGGTEQVRGLSRQEGTKEAGEGLDEKKTCQGCLLLQREDEKGSGVGAGVGVPGTEGGRTVQLLKWNPERPVQGPLIQS